MTDALAASEKDAAIWRAAKSTQPEVALIIDGYAVVAVQTLARHEERTGQAIRLERNLAAAVRERDALRAAAERIVYGPNRPRSSIEVRMILRAALHSEAES